MSHLIPLVSLLLALLALFGRPLVAGRLVLPLDILGYFYPWNSQARGIFTPSYPQNPLIQDLTTLMTPWFLFARDQIQHGRIPLWNPWQAGGTPFLANDESAIFFPLQ